MYIRRVVLQNIKGFKEAELDFATPDNEYPGFSVITGDNGTGKTAFLRAIALATLGPDQSRGLVPDLSGWVTEGLNRGTISVEVLPNHDLDRTRRGGFPVQGTFWAEVEIIRDGATWVINPTDVFRKKRLSAVNGPWHSTTAGWFVLGYGPFRRMYGSSPDAQRLMVIPGRIPHFATLFKEDATLAEGEEWVKQLKYKRLEDREEESLALANLLLLVKDDFLRHGVLIEEVNSDGIWLRDAAGRLVPLSDMSEGYRSALAMLIDIYRHMVDVYGPKDLVQVSDDEKYRVVRPGVVLIDEVDAHLHPQWQRVIGFWMKDHFPEVQFIVTTHSPIVCQAADGGRVYHMPSLSDGESPFQLSTQDFHKVIGGKPDEILLTPAFGMEHTRSPRAVAARRRRAQLLSRQMTLGGLGDDELHELRQLSLFAGEQ